VLAYDTEYAMVDRDDDERIAQAHSIKTSAMTLGRFDVVAIMLFYVVHLTSWLALGWSLGLGGWFVVGVLAAAVQALWHGTLIRTREREACFRAFRANHWVGFSLFVGSAVDLLAR
jgi:4-hydroxybenzoate polyprenyltransferase